MPLIYVHPVKPRRYGLSNFVGDFVMTCLTGGLWLVWVAVREVSR